MRQENRWHDCQIKTKPSIIIIVVRSSCVAIYLIFYLIGEQVALPGWPVPNALRPP